jgi:hypothetical protein
MTDITIIRGDSYVYDINFKDDDGVAINITDSTVFFTVKTRFDTDNTDVTNTVLKKTITTHTNPVGGITQFVLSSAETGTLDITKYVYDVQYKSSAGAIKTVLQGFFIVTNDVTRRTT